MSVISGPVTAAGVGACALFSGAYLFVHPEGAAQSGHEVAADWPEVADSTDDTDDGNGWGNWFTVLLLGLFVFRLVKAAYAFPQIWDKLKSLCRKTPEHTKGHLMLQVLSATNLKNVDSGVKRDVSDAYCRAMVGQEANQTQTIPNNLNPVWKKETHGNLLVVSNGNLRCVNDVNRDGDLWSSGWDSDGRIVPDGIGGAFIVSHGNLRYCSDANKSGEVWSTNWKTDDDSLCSDGRGGLFVTSRSHLYHVTALQKNPRVDQAWSTGWNTRSMVCVGENLFIISRGHLYKVTKEKKDGILWSKGWADEASMTSNGEGGVFVVSRGNLYNVDDGHRSGQKWSSAWRPSSMTYAGPSGLFIVSSGNLFNVSEKKKDGGERWSADWKESHMVSNGSDSLYLISRGNLWKVTASCKDGERFTGGWHAASCCFSEAKEVGEWSYDVDLKDEGKNELLLHVFDGTHERKNKPVFTSIGEASVDLTEFAFHSGTSISKTIPLLESLDGQNVAKGKANGGEVKIKARFEPLSAVEAREEARKALAAASAGASATPTPRTNVASTAAAAAAAAAAVEDARKERERLEAAAVATSAAAAAAAAAAPTINGEPYSNRVDEPYSNRVDAPYSDRVGEPTPTNSARTSEPLKQNEIRVTVVNAIGLEGMMNFTVDQPYVYCLKVGAHTGTKQASFSTNPVKEKNNPVWNEVHTIAHWAPGDDLEFTIYNKGLFNSKTEGKVILPSGEFFPNGFDGEIPISSDRIPTASNTSGHAPNARLRVTVECPAGLIALPNGWECAMDAETGVMYYYNHETNESQWEHPN